MNKSTDVLKRCRQYLRDRPDTEHEQAIIRVIITLIVILFFYTSKDGPWNGEQASAAGLLVLFLGISIILLFSILVRPDASITRRTLGIFLDLSGFSYFMATTGELMAPWYPVYLWVVFGNGFRYGERFLYLSTFLALAGFSCVLLFNDFWHANISIGIGLLLALIVLPGYAAVLTRRLNAARRKAEEANQAKSDFLARMSHEIRTPMNGILATAELMQDQQQTVEEREYTEMIIKSGRNLLQIIEEILDVSKIEAGKLPIELIPFDLYQLLIEVKESFKAQARQKGLYIRLNIDPSTPYNQLGDPLRIRQVLTNLIGNAIKFTTQGYIYIRCRPASSEENQGMVHIEIEDTGIGMSEDVQRRIFDRFTQADESTTREYGGTGLGTTIAKQLVELMQGTIGVESTPGKGSTFWFQIPDNRGREPGNEIDPGTTSEITIYTLTGETPEIITLLRSAGLEFKEISSSDIETGLDLEKRGVILTGYDRVQQLSREEKETLEKNVTQNRLLQILVNSNDIPDTSHSSRMILDPPLTRQRLHNLLHLASLILPQAKKEVQTMTQGIIANFKVMVVEDNATNRMLIGRILERAGYPYSLAENGEMALSVLKDESFDLVIIDMQMPVLSGLETFKMYNFAHPDRKIPFIMLTANATDEARDACQQAGIDYFMTKPVSPARLIELLDQVSNTLPGATQNKVSETGSSVYKSAIDEFDQHTIEDIRQLAPDTTFLQQLRISFVEDSRQLLKAMVIAQVAGDKDAYSDTAHALKGSASNLGLLKLQAQAKAAESLPAEALASEGQTLIVEMHDALEKADKHLRVTFSE